MGFIAKAIGYVVLFFIGLGFVGALMAPTTPRATDPEAIAAVQAYAPIYDLVVTIRVDDWIEKNKVLESISLSECQMVKAEMETKPASYYGADAYSLECVR